MRAVEPVLDLLEAQRGGGRGRRAGHERVEADAAGAERGRSGHSLQYAAPAESLGGDLVEGLVGAGIAGNVVFVARHRRAVVGRHELDPSHPNRLAPPAPGRMTYLLQL